jgi:hypothetical protein
LWRDFKTFYTQYNLRRDKSLGVFPAILTDWFDRLPDTDKQMQELAEQEGWILTPSSTNIADPLEKY